MTTTSMTHIIRTTLALIAFLLALTSMSVADDRPLIWNFSKSSETSYSAKIGSRLATTRPSSLGADVRVRGPDPTAFSDPVTFWGMITLAEPAPNTKGRSTHVEGRIDGGTGKRRVALNNTLTRNVHGVDVRLSQEYTLDYDPLGNREVRARNSQTLRLYSSRTRTEVHMRASRAQRGEWRTSVSVEQPVQKRLNLTATVENPALESRRGRFRANYRYTW